MHLRLSREGDLPAIVRIYNQAIRQWRDEGDQPVTAFQELLTVAGRREWFERHDPSLFPIWVVEEEDDVAGWCSLSPYRSGRAALRRATEVSYYVDARYRRRGIGSALMDRAMAAAPEFGFDTVIAILLEGNEASVGLLRRFGFSEWGRFPDLAVFGEERYDHLMYGRHVGDLAVDVADDAG